MSTATSSATSSPALPPCGETFFWTPELGSNGTVVIDVRSFDQVLADIERQGEAPDPTPRITFASYELLHKTLAPNRMAIVEAMSGQGPMSIREVARRVGRDFKGVHSDVGVLTRNGVLMKTAEGQVIFPYAKIHFDFEFAAADQSAA